MNGHWHEALSLDLGYRLLSRQHGSHGSAYAQALFAEETCGDSDMCKDDHRDHSAAFMLQNAERTTVVRNCTADSPS